MGASLAPVPDVQACLPAGYSAYNLLTALDFNAHTGYRYQESSGTEVVMESPGLSGWALTAPSPTTAAAGPPRSSSRFPPRRATPPPWRLLRAAMKLAAALTEGTGASPLYLRGVTATDTGWQLIFGYQSSYLPVIFSDGEEALSVTITGRTVTAFTYRCRAYAPHWRRSPPCCLAAMAMAIASLRPGSGAVPGLRGRRRLRPCPPAGWPTVTCPSFPRKWQKGGPRLGDTLA